MGFIKDWGIIGGIAGIALGVFLLLFRELIKRTVLSTLTKKQSYIFLLVCMLLVWSVSAFSIIQYSYENYYASLQVTVLVRSEKGKDELVLTNRGKVKLIYGDANVIETINDKGEATFKQIPPVFFGSNARVEIHFFDPQGEPYRVLNPDSLYQLVRGKYISLPVKLFGLSQLRGVVKNFETGEFVKDVRISIAGTEIKVFTNQWGEYNLSIPVNSQQQFQTVRAYKEGYEPVELQHIPVQTNSECPIVIKPNPK